jgi:hypothetical protein
VNNITRRNAFKILCGVPLAASALELISSESGSKDASGQKKTAKIAKTVDSTPRLNVVLHGMFALCFDYKSTPNTLTILAPKLYGHTYGAGDWRKESFLDQEDGSYDLKFASAKTPMSPQQVKQVSGALIAWRASGVSGIQAPGSDVSPYCTLNVGIPDDIWALRKLVRTASDPPFFEGKAASDNGLDSVLQLPLVHVLTYTNVDSSNPPNFGDWKGAAAASFWNLHIHAEPSFQSPPGHLSHGLAKLCKMFTPTPLDLKFKQGNTAIFGTVDTDLTTGHSTMKVEEEEALEEIREGIFATDARTSKVHSCMSLITLSQ